MDFLTYIAKGVANAGTQKALADAIGVSETNLSKMIKGKVPIPKEALAKLALVIGDGTTPGDIWQAQNFHRAETEEERQLWLPFLSRAACVMALASAFCVTHPAETQAQPTVTGKHIFIMSSCRVVKVASPFV